MAASRRGVSSGGYGCDVHFSQGIPQGEGVAGQLLTPRGMPERHLWVRTSLKAVADEPHPNLG